LSSAQLHAEEAIVGKYSGSYPGRATNGGSAVQLGIAIDIKTVQGDAITGTMAKQGGWRPCSGDSPVEGTYKDNQVKIRATQEIGPSGCGRPAFTGVVEGNALVGKWGTADVKLIK